MAEYEVELHIEYSRKDSTRQQAFATSWPRQAAKALNMHGLEVLDFQPGYERKVGTAREYQWSFDGNRMEYVPVKKRMGYAVGTLTVLTYVDARSQAEALEKGTRAFRAALKARADRRNSWYRPQHLVTWCYAPTFKVV